MLYLVELKQLVKFPRCRIYRQFIRELMDNHSLRSNGSCGLFHYMVLCSYANFASSTRIVGAERYILSPGEWVCTTADITSWFRLRFQRQAITILQKLQAAHLIEFSLIGKGAIVKFKILGWEQCNKIIDCKSPCQKDRGFFFFAVSKAQELVSRGRCSELDMVLDIWLHAIYNDPQVLASEDGPVAYFRNGTGNPTTTYSDLAARWGVAKSTVFRTLSKLSQSGYLQIISFTGRTGSVIYLKNYLSVMFNISDTAIDKNEVALHLNVKVDVEEQMPGELVPNDAIKITVPAAALSVPETHLQSIVQKLARVLAALGLTCATCNDAEYLLSNLSDCGGNQFTLEVICGRDGGRNLFQLTLNPAADASLPLRKGGVEHD